MFLRMGGGRRGPDCLVAVCPRTLGVLLPPLQAVLAGIVGGVVVMYGHHTLYLRPNLPAPCPPPPKPTSPSFFVSSSPLNLALTLLAELNLRIRKPCIRSVLKRLRLWGRDKKKKVAAGSKRIARTGRGVAGNGGISSSSSGVFSVEGLQVRLCASRQRETAGLLGRWLEMVLLHSQLLIVS